MTDIEEKVESGDVIMDDKKKIDETIGKNTDSSEKKDAARKSKRRKVEVIENKATDVVTKDSTKEKDIVSALGDSSEHSGKMNRETKEAAVTENRVSTAEKSVSDDVETDSDVTKDAEKKSDVKEAKKTKFTIKAKPKKSDASKDKTDATTEKVKSFEKSYDLKKTQNIDSDKKVATESEPLPPGVEKDDLAEPADDVTEKDDVIKAGGRLEQADLEDALEMGEDEGEEGEDTELSHQEAMNIYQKNLAKIIEDDPLLCDLATTCSLEEVRGRVALEHGQAMAVNVVKDTAEIMGVFVVQEGTVLDLKQAIKQHVMLHLERNALHKPISWRYIWKTYWLYFEGQKLDDDRKKLKDYGIRNKSEVLFLKKLRPK